MLSSNPMFSSSIPLPSQFLYLFLICLSLLLSPVRPEPSSSVLRLPTDHHGEWDACPETGSRPASCPVRCFRPDPVCGEDGVTYWCGCADAECSGVRVVKAGFCEVGSGGSGQALLLVHIVWLIVLGFFVCFGFF